MAHKVLQSEKYDFQVESAPSFMQLPDGSFVRDGFIVNRRTDTMAVLGKATERYGLIQNAHLVDVAESAFKAEGLTNYTRRMVVTGKGEKMYAVYDFKNQVKAMKVGDEVGFRLTLQNSFDGSLRGSFALGALRLACLNGATSIERESSVTRKHSVGISVEFVVLALEKAITGWEKTIGLYDQLAAIPITDEQGVNILAHLAKDNTLSEKLREGVAGIWLNPTRCEDKARNLWNLYNATTDFLTHNVSAERFELSNRVDNDVLREFARVTRDKTRFANLVTPLPAEISELALN